MLNCAVEQMKLEKEQQWLLILIAIVLLGIGLRVLYVSVTPYDVRGHDIHAHTDYIKYVAEHLRIPPAHEGWEFYQAPLYYVITGIFSIILSSFSVTQDHILQIIQIGSLAISMVTLLVGIYIGALLFPKDTQRIERMLFGLVIATFPSLIFLSSRITNNGLFHLFAFIYVALMWKWWLSSNNKILVVILILIPIAFVTRINAILFLAITLLCLLFRQKVTATKKMKLSAIAIALFVILAGWFPLMRLFEEHNYRAISFGRNILSQSVIIENNPEDFVTFNPYGILTTPLNEPHLDEARRRNFWEYYFRSSFFGEWQFQDTPYRILQSILLLGMLCLAFCLRGIYDSLKNNWYGNLPLLLMLLFGAAGAVAFRIYVKCSCAQDFRYSVWLVPAFTYFCLIGIRSQKTPITKLGYWIVGLLSAACLAFIVTVYR